MRARVFSMMLVGPLCLLAGCASVPAAASNPAPAGHDVVGAGSSSDRAAINSSNQQIFDAEHAMDSDPAVAPNGQGQNQGIP